MKLNKLKLDEIKDLLGRLPRILAEKSFFTFLALLFIFLALSALLYYKYVISVERAKPEILEKPLQLNEGAFQDVLNKILERTKKSEEAESKNYPNLFARPPAAPPLTP